MFTSHGESRPTEWPSGRVLACGVVNTGFTAYASLKLVFSLLEYPSLETRLDSNLILNS